MASTGMDRAVVEWKKAEAEDPTSAPKDKKTMVAFLNGLNKYTKKVGDIRKGDREQEESEDREQEQSDEEIMKKPQQQQQKKKQRRRRNSKLKRRSRPLNR